MSTWTSGYVQVMPLGNSILNAATRQPIDLAMQRLNLAGRVQPLGGLLQITHTFRCDGDDPIEALYTFMLPRGGVARRFIVKGDGFEVESSLTPREDARKEYEEGVQSGHLSVLAEANVDGMVTLSIGQIRPDEDVTVIVEVFAGVDARDNGFRFRFPFTLAPNYHGQAKMVSTPGGGRCELPESVFGDLILPEWKTNADNLHQISFRLHVDSSGPLGSVASPSHNIAVEMNADGSADITLAGLGDHPDRDLVLDVSTRELTPVVFADDPAGSTMQMPSDAPRWTLTMPSSSVPRASDAPRKVCFLLDKSGSMEGPRMDRAKIALKACLSALSATDEFGIVYFSDGASVFHPKMALATDAHRKQAHMSLQKVRADGGTELGRALGKAVEVLGGPGGDIFLLTDGEVMGIGGLVEQSAACGTRIHVLGIGAASQDRFLSALSRRTGGIERMVGVNEDVATAALDLFNSVKQPVQQNVKATVTMDGSAQSQVHDLGTVWDGHPIVITDNGSSGSSARPVDVEITWDTSQTTKVNVASLIRKAPCGLTALLWAGQQVEDLESAIDMAGDGPAKVAMEQSLKKISVDYGLASRVMSLCAVVKRVGDQAGVTPEQRIVPVGMPADMKDAHGVFQVSTAGAITQQGWVNGTVGAYAPPGVTLTTAGFRGGGPQSVNVYACSAGVSSAPDMAWGSPTRGMGIRRGARPSGIMLRDCSDSYDSSDDMIDSMDVQVVNYTTPAFGDFLVILGTLQADGGVPGLDLADRVLKTALLAVELVNQAAATRTRIYESHVRRMVAFLTANPVHACVPDLVRVLRAGRKISGAPASWEDLAALL